MRLAVKSKHPIKTQDMASTSVTGKRHQQVSGGVIKRAASKRQALYGFWRTKRENARSSPGRIIRGESSQVMHGTLNSPEEILNSLMGRR